MPAFYRPLAGVLLAAALAPSARAGNPPAPTLAIHHINVGKGDAILIVSPTGTTMLIDAGIDGHGHDAVVPYLHAHGIGALDYINASHYDRDHIGGIDEVIEAGFLPTVVYDRGTYYELPETHEYVDYAAAVAPVRQTIAPDQVIDLGGGVTARCVAVNGQLTGGGSYPIEGLPDFENGASVCFLITFGSFTYLAMGDLQYQVENQLGLLIGDVDALKVSHHGGHNGTSPSFVAAVTPEVSFMTVGGRSTFPAQATMTNLSPASGMTWVYQTEITNSGAVGALVAGGDIVLTTDGATYTVTGDNLVPRSFLCDELAGTAPGPGDLAVGEVLPDPLAVDDTLGEFVELTNLTGQALSLEGFRFRDNLGQLVTVRSSALFGPRETLAFGRHGFRRWNGGLAAAGVWPLSAFALGTSDAVVIEAPGSVLIDSVAWVPSNVSASYSLEREDLYQPASGASMRTIGLTYGAGDHGTPGKPNAMDTTPFVPIVIEVCPPAGSLQGGELVTISGYDLATTPPPIVLFGTAPATDVTVIDAHTLTARTPAHGVPEPVDVSLMTPNGSGDLPSGFTYQ